MNVRELKKMLDKYPDDMEILNGRYSDYALVVEEGWYIIKAVPMDSWEGAMRSHPTMSDENKALEKEYLYLVGN